MDSDLHKWIEVLTIKHFIKKKKTMLVEKMKQVFILIDPFKFSENI